MRSPTGSPPRRPGACACRATPAAVAIFHPLQYPLARGLLARHPAAELWYGRWDRYEEAYDAGPRMRERLASCTRLARERAALTFVASDALAALEREAGGEATLVPLAADRFPAPDPAAAVVAISLGHLGRRTDWALLRAVSEAMPELVLLLVGDWHDDEVRRRPRLPRLPRRPEPRVARPALRRGGRPADPVRRRRHRPVRALRRSTTPASPTGSSSTPGSAAARSPPTWRACARGTAR